MSTADSPIEVNCTFQNLGIDVLSGDLSLRSLDAFTLGGLAAQAGALLSALGRQGEPALCHGWVEEVARQVVPDGSTMMNEWTVWGP